MGAPGNSIEPNLDELPVDPSATRYSVVVPVFNEDAVIGQFCRRARAQLPDGYELLICYDFDEDTTLPALRALPSEEKPSGLRLIRNDLGRGVRYAIEAGMNAATSSVVVVTMADLSDDWSRVLQMIELIESGADVVSASRYMKGGQQIGGPLLKRVLSQTAGLTLYWIAGIPTHDPTNSYRAYSKRFLDEVQIESTAGFSLGLELTVKAHFLGGIVREVPTVWHDRPAGESRFLLFAWLPHYLRWYLWAIGQRCRLFTKFRLNPKRPEQPAFQDQQL